MQKSLVGATTLAIVALGVAGCATAQDAASSAAAVKASCASPVGDWVNQMGSKLRIKRLDPSTGALSGEYQTASGAGGWYPLVGWVNSAPPTPNADNAMIVSFSVRWTNIGSVTSWTGFCRGTDELRTVWQLGRSNSQFEWDHVLTGADQFKPL